MLVLHDIPAMQYGICSQIVSTAPTFFTAYAAIRNLWQMSILFNNLAGDWLSHACSIHQIGCACVLGTVWPLYQRLRGLQQGCSVSKA